MSHKYASSVLTTKAADTIKQVNFFYGRRWEKKTLTNGEETDESESVNKAFVFVASEMSVLHRSTSVQQSAQRTPLILNFSMHVV